MIVTSYSLLWTLLSVVAFTAVLSALITPRWLVGPESPTHGSNRMVDIPTLGIFNRCILLNGRSNCANFDSEGFATDPARFPSCWKATFIFMSLGLFVMGTTVLAALLGCYVQSVGRKSIFNLAGVGQAVAGLFYILGMMLYPGGWSEWRVQHICPSAKIYHLGECTLGWAFYCAVLGVALTFVCAMLSEQAEKSTASDQVQDKINEGNILICLA